MTHEPIASEPGAAHAAPGPGAIPAPGLLVPPADEPAPRRRWPELLIGLAVIAIGVITILDGLSQPASTSASGLGAGQFPIIVGSLTALLGALLVVQVLRGRLGHPDAAEGDVDTAHLRWWQLALTAAALVLFALTVDVLGYPIAAAITFVAVAVATGAKRWLLTIGIAVVLSLGVFYLFTLLLRIQLPAGILTGIL
ncbi:tripartite tricarboxylate transporter TctB family protein [Agrococcus sp. HG114]|uniref:tripartite tricarboxylate transporter TctB family protein n=1 Tax=Agrococcus sp. HG114 TaxID=2969757 RepID=UPI00215B6A39|nr:tripartite tricarboxylate transporter TctB family protein [Agrococcus sp. HG114]MCR8671486.1 tripartite tricarboxylate transporter TctB family protein [Agrococcus sp. HG114]